MADVTQQQVVDYIKGISVLELFWTLARGFTVVVQEPIDRMSPLKSSVAPLSIVACVSTAVSSRSSPLK